MILIEYVCAVVEKRFDGKQLEELRNQTTKEVK